MNILITGATGFIGKHLLEQVSKNSNYNISVITRDLSKINVSNNNISVLKADLIDVNSLIEAFKNIDIVINTAAEVRNYNQLEKTNVQGTKNIVTAAIKNNVKKIIHLSSVGVVGMQYSISPIEVDENTLCNPKNEYERTKLQSEKILIESAQNNNFELIILRPTNVYGENHPLNAMLTILKHITTKKPIVITKTALYNYVYVKDLVSVMIKMVEHTGKPIEIFNVGEATVVKDFILIVQKQLGVNSIIFYLPKFIIKFLNGIGITKLTSLSNEVSYSDKKLKTIFEYNLGLENGIRNTILFYKGINKL